MAAIICSNPDCPTVISFAPDGTPKQRVRCPDCKWLTRVNRSAHGAAQTHALPAPPEPTAPVPPPPVAKIAPPLVRVEPDAAADEPLPVLPAPRLKRRVRFLQSWLATWLGLRLIFIGKAIDLFLRALLMLALAGMLVLIISAIPELEARAQPPAGPRQDAEMILMIIALVMAGLFLLALVADGLVNLGFLFLVFVPSRSGARVLGFMLALTTTLYLLVVAGTVYVVVFQAQRGNLSLRLVEQISQVASVALGFVGFIQRMLLWSLIYRMGIGLKAHQLRDGAYDLVIGFLWLIVCLFLLICPPIGFVVVLWYGFRLLFDELSLISEAAQIAGQLSRS